MNVEKAINIDDLKLFAKRRMPRISFDFVEGGVEDEYGLDHNAAAFRNRRLVPRYLTDVSTRHQTVTLFGKTYASPFGIAPTGLAGLFRRNADLFLATAAVEANIPYIMSSVANASLEQAAAIARDNMWFQIYCTNTKDVMWDLIRRAELAGIQVLVVTADVPLPQKRERNLRNGFSHPLKMTAASMIEALAHPAWVYEYFRHGGMPMMENWRKYSPDGASADQVAAVFAKENPCPGQTWSDIEEIRRRWPGQLVIKGILHPDDARRAVNAGADAVYVSNHGGRQFDRAPAPIEVLPAISAAIGSKTTILMDSGIRRGIDIVTARCLGARAAFVGRATLYGTAAGGLQGARRAIDILRQEIDMALGGLGCAAVEDLGPEYLHEA
jgi:(S)-mandelate dehydrogenase